MRQLVYKDKIYIYGNMQEVLKQLKELSLQHKTLKDLLSYYLSDDR